jgi:hypothetical protein
MSRSRTRTAAASSEAAARSSPVIVWRASGVSMMPIAKPASRKPTPVRPGPSSAGITTSGSKGSSTTLTKSSCLEPK